MSDTAHNSAYSQTLHWLARHAGFPAVRLPERAELMLLVAAAAAAEEAEENSRTRHLIKSRDVARDSALKAHNLRRNQVHYKCDNSAKV